MVATLKVGAIKILVQSGAGIKALEEYRHMWKEINADYIAENLKDAIHWLFDLGI